MKRMLVALLLLTLAGLPLGASSKDKSKDEERLENCGVVLKEIMNIPDDIPQDLIDKAECVIVFPSVKKGAFIVGGEYGRGAMSCRTGGNFEGPWGAPTMMALEGGSVGFQIGGEATDFVLLVMNPSGANSILSSKVKLGADASVAAGPVGRTAQADTDAYMRAEILTYSRSRGVFAGISLAGTTLRPDRDSNKAIYGKDVDPKELVRGREGGAPESARLMIETLNQRSPHSASAKK